MAVNWGDPVEVQKFRAAALTQGIGGQAQVDAFIQQNQAAYQQQAGHDTNAQVYGQTAGGISPDQALKDPIATQTYLKGGGQIIDPISSMAKSIINGDTTLSDVSDPTQKSQVDAAIRKQGLDPNRLPNDPNTRSIKGSLQSILDTYNSLPADKKGPGGELASKIPYFGQYDPVTTYNQQRTGLSASLSQALGPGKGNGLRLTQTEVQGWSNLLPQAGKTLAQNQTSIETLDKKMRASTGQGLDEPYLASLGVRRDDKGNYIRQKSAPDTQSNPLIDAVGKTIGNVPQDAGNILNGILGAPRAAYQQGQQAAQMAQKGDTSGMQAIQPNAMIFNMLKGYGNSLNKDLGQPLQGGDIAGRIGQNFQQRPVSTTLDMLPFLLRGKPGTSDAGMSSNAPGAPSKLTQLLNPQAAKNAGSAMRNNAIQNAVSTGKTVAGDDLINGLNDWAKTAKMGNLSEGAKIQEALANANDIFKGQSIDPKDLVKAYMSADSGYTVGGIPKTATQSLIDRGLKDVIGKELEKVAPGWEKGTKIIGQSFKTDKSVMGKIAKGLPSRAVGAGLNIGGLGLIGHLLGL